MNLLSYTRSLLYVLIGLMVVALWIRPLQERAEWAERDLQGEFYWLGYAHDPLTKKIKTVVANWDLVFSEEHTEQSATATAFSKRGGVIAGVHAVQNPAGRVVEIWPDGTIYELARFNITAGSTLVLQGKRDGAAER